jgi:hypothetical protein
MRRLAGLLVLAAALAAPAAPAAAPGPSQLSITVTNAVFKGRFGTAWNLLHPRQRAVASKARFAACHAKELTAMGKLHILRVEAATTQTGTAAFPPLGTIPVAVVTVRITYTAPGVTGAQVGTNTAYWTRDKGTWYGLLSPASYKAFKAGTCP